MKTQTNFLKGSIFLGLVFILIFSSCRDNLDGISDQDLIKKPLNAFEGPNENIKDWNTLAENLVSQEMNQDNIIQERKRPVDPNRNCTGVLPDEGSVIVWPFYCTGEGDVGDCTTPANDEVLDVGDELEKYVKCKAPIVAIPLDYEVTEFETLDTRYHEGEVEEVCGVFNPWKYLGFANNCSVKVDELQALGEYLYAIGMANTPAVNGVYFDGVTINWTAWDECDFHQLHDQWTCKFKSDATVYPCGASFWASSPDCSFCKDVCEYRAIGVSFHYVKQVYVGIGPG